MGDEPEPQQARSAYLLDGRRVLISDLMEAGLLASGEVLQFKRPRLRETHRAVVTPAGTLALDGGQEFSSPSSAAAVAADMKSVDGWRAWTVTTTGRSLDLLRQELLDQAAARESPDSANSRDDMHGRYEWLNDARARADAGNPVQISVRDLIARWDARADGTTLYQRIDADLANHGLDTSPSFRKVSLDTIVRLITPSQKNGMGGLPASNANGESELDVGLTVGNLPSALRPVAAVAPNATFDEAITLMALNGYSQLAVLSGTHSLRGAVTWQSIAYTRHSKPGAKFADAIIRAHEARYDQELVEILPDLERWDFVFVRNERNEVAGIVTTADVAAKYRELSTPFILIGELDQVLRQLISRTFTLNEVTSLCDADGGRSIRSFGDLEMGDYQRVLENPDRWAKLGWPLDRTIFIKQLDGLRVVRNNVMHFNPEPLPEDTVAKLRYILTLLRDFGGLLSAS